VLKTLDAVSFQGSALAGGDALHGSGAAVSLDVGARLRDMW
jgi:hypothetical protein